MSNIEFKFKYEHQWKLANPEDALLQFEKEQKSEEVLLKLWEQNGLVWLVSATKHVIDETQGTKKKLVNPETDFFVKNGDYFEFQELLDSMGTPWLSETLHTYYPEEIKGTFFEIVYKMTLA